MSRPQTPPPQLNTTNLPFGNSATPATNDRLLGVSATTTAIKPSAAPSSASAARSNDANTTNNNDVVTSLNFGQNNNTSNSKKKQKPSEHRRTASSGTTVNPNSNPSRHHHRTPSSQIDVVYAVDADIRRPDPFSPTSTTAGDGPTVASPTSPIPDPSNPAAVAAAAAKKDEKKKKKKKTRDVEVQTKLSYFGDYSHGRPVLLRQDDPEIYMGKSVCVLLMFGMVIDIMVGSISYFVSWRIREPMVMGTGNQELFSKVYPAALIVGVMITYLVSLPVLGWIVSGYFDAAKHDKYFLFAQLVYTIFFGLPAILTEALWIGPMTKDEIQFYQPYQVKLSQVALVFHCLASGASLWYFYLVFLSRKLNDAVERRRDMKIQQLRGVMGKRTLDADRIAIKTVEEIQESQQNEEMFTLDEMGIKKFENSSANQYQKILEALAEGNQRKARMAHQKLMEHELELQHQEEEMMMTRQHNEGDGKMMASTGTITDHAMERQLSHYKKTASTIVTSPLPPLQKETKTKSDAKGIQSVKVGDQKFFAVSSAVGGAEAAEETGEENAWGAPYKNPPETPPPSTNVSRTRILDVPATPSGGEGENVGDGGAASAEGENATTLNPPGHTRVVSFLDENNHSNSNNNTRNGNDDDDDAGSIVFTGGGDNNNNAFGNENDDDPFVTASRR